MILQAEYKNYKLPKNREVLNSIIANYEVLQLTLLNNCRSSNSSEILEINNKKLGLKLPLN